MSRRSRREKGRRMEHAKHDSVSIDIEAGTGFSALTADVVERMRIVADSIAKAAHTFQGLDVFRLASPLLPRQSDPPPLTPQLSIGMDTTRGSVLKPFYELPIAVEHPALKALRTLKDMVEAGEDPAMSVWLAACCGGGVVRDTALKPMLEYLGAHAKVEDPSCKNWSQFVGHASIEECLAVIDAAVAAVSMLPYTPSFRDLSFGGDRVPIQRAREHELEARRQAKQQRAQDREWEHAIEDCHEVQERRTWLQDGPAHGYDRFDTFDASATLDDYATFVLSYRHDAHSSAGRPAPAPEPEPKVSYLDWLRQLRKQESQTDPGDAADVQ